MEQSTLALTGRSSLGFEIELRTIALEESNHAALAWRTFKWVCSVDSDACTAVKQKILNVDKMERAFHRRFGSSNGRYDALEIMADSWKKIYSQHESHDQVCISGGVGGGDDNIHDGTLVPAMADSVVYGALCA